jgi:hypothetical protein
LIYQLSEIEIEAYKTINNYLFFILKKIKFQNLIVGNNSTTINNKQIFKQTGRFETFVTFFNYKI